MMFTPIEDRRLWSVILAGGDGHRMRPLIQRWLGECRAKQYCTFVGTRSMFQHTLDRANMLTPPARRISVIARSHKDEVLQQLGRCQAGRILVQPANCDTAAGIFLALTYVRARDPQAIVAVFPSDHFIFPDSRFIVTVRSAAGAADIWRERIVLLGASPDRPEPDYGWIKPGAQLGRAYGCPVWEVQAFVEKPCAERARQAMADGALWNTLVFVARVETLWNLGQRCFPLLIHKFERLKAAIDSRLEEQVLDEIYRSMPAHNFSSQLLAQVTDQVAVIELRDVIWCDWGRPERIADTLQELGKRPAFTEEHLRAS
jgi:mannose-1-phosphate guanylyltransferase